MTHSTVANPTRRPVVKAENDVAVDLFKATPLYIFFTAIRGALKR